MSITNTTTFKLAQAVGLLGSAGASSGILTITFFSIPPLLLPANSNTRRRQQQQQQQQQEKQEQDKPESTTTTVDSNIQHLLHQWNYIYTKGGNTFPYLVAGSALAYAYVVYLLQQHQHQQHILHRGSSSALYRVYLLAATVTISAIPFSLTFVERPWTRKLVSLIKKVDSGTATPKEEEEVPELIDGWARWNIGRGIFPLVGAVVGVVGVLWV